jgi:hypothetical protein
VKVTKGEPLREEWLEGVEYTRRIGALHCDLSVVVSCSCKMGKDLSLWHLLVAEIPCSTAIQGRLQRSEHCGTVAQSSELHMESIEHIFTLFEIVRHAASGA